MFTSSCYSIYYHWLIYFEVLQGQGFTNISFWRGTGVKILGSRSKSTKTVDVKSVHLDKGLIFPSSVGKEFNWLHFWVLHLFNVSFLFTVSPLSGFMTRTAKQCWWQCDKHMTFFLPDLPALGTYWAPKKLEQPFLFCHYGHVQVHISTRLCSTSQEAAVSGLLLQLDEFIYFVFKCRTYLNSTASWCSSQFLSVSYCSVALPHPCPRSSLASCTVELIWLKNNPANSKMINSQGWITDCSPNALSVTQSHGSRPHADAALGAQWWHRRGRCLQGSTRVVPFRWTWMSHPQKLSFFFPQSLHWYDIPARLLITTNATGWVCFGSGIAGWFSHTRGSNRFNTADTDSSSSSQLCFVARCLFSTAHTGAGRRMRSVSKISGLDATAKFSMVTSITLKFGSTCLFTVWTNKYGLKSILKEAISVTEAIQNCHIYRQTKEVQERENPLFLCVHDTVSFLLLLFPPLFQFICT